LLALPEKLLPGVAYFVPTQQRAIALTIDDGPDGKTTPAILQVLGQYQAKATFFLISSRIAGNEGRSPN
ncbi:MAG: polysaccharide deacetylase family protein, partial [Chloroflexaceae bacterium]|nr:polysaccharide deacetylase family protein [Chloroflexaceae bacterium]